MAFTVIDVGYGGLKVMDVAVEDTISFPCRTKVATFALVMKTVWSPSALTNCRATEK